MIVVSSKVKVLLCYLSKLKRCVFNLTIGKKDVIATLDQVSNDEKNKINELLSIRSIKKRATLNRND